MDPANVDLETALKLLSLPRLLGKDPESQVEVYADLGRYGQYVRRGTDTCTVNPPDNVLELSLERALQLLREKPPGRRFARGAPAVLRELGKSPQGGAAVKLLSGRYGPYVTDGVINASLPRDASPEAITLAEALELLRARAERAPAKGPRARRGRTAKKPPKPAKGKAGKAKKKRKPKKAGEGESSTADA
jgi:DNA topoisomerase-1